MAITNPMLPPKPGYVEVEENGVRKYKPTAETAEKETKEQKNAQLRADIDYLSVMLGVKLL